MSQRWESLLFETTELGVSSAVAPELLPDNQAAWGMNIDTRGGKPGTRPNLSERLILPSGLIQGGEFFGVQGGMIVVSIAGRLWRIRINGSAFSYEEIELDFVNSPIIKQVWMTQTVETLVIQDWQSDAILYDGSTAVRAGPGQVPRGRQMAYGNGRLWVAVDLNEVVAGDIRTNAPGSELKFTEATYLTGGGKLFFTSPIAGMAFIPVTGQADYGALLVYGNAESHAIRADITSRDDWGKVPGFVTNLLRSVGATSQWAITSVNQDLYWRDSNGGIRSIRNALADETGPGSAPISREVSRLTDYDSQQLLPWCSSVYFDNRLLMTSSPFLLPNGGVGWGNLISLDFAPLSRMGGKSQPAYNGKWNGVNFVKLVAGNFGGKNRAFALVTDDDGVNSLWEFGTGARADGIINCQDGTGEIVTMENRITSYIDYPRRDFGAPKNRKLLDRCDVWLSDVDGEVDLKVYWRSDNWQKWLQWDEAATCAKTSDASTAAPHVWKNLLPQYRPQFKTFTIPDTINDLVGYAANNGFEFQIRLVWTGRCRIHRLMLHAQVLGDPDYADRTGFEVACVENDVGDGGGNEVEYSMRTNCEACVLEFESQPENQSTEPGGDVVFSVEVSSPIEPTYQWQQSLDDGDTWEDLESGTHVSGEKTADLSLSDIPEEWNGRLFRCVVTLPGCAPSPDGQNGLKFNSDSALMLIGSIVPCDSFEGSLRGGTYTLCGFAEFTDPSTPPKKYRTMQYGGAGKNYNLESIASYCSTAFSTNDTVVYSGFCTLDPMTCEQTVTGNKYHSIFDSRTMVEPEITNTPICGDQFEGGWTSATQLTAFYTYSASGALFCDVSEPAGNYSNNDDFSELLSDEDTEADAAARLIASSSWGPYDSGTQPLAQWQSDRVGFSGAYMEARFQGTATVPEGQTRFVSIGYYRRVYGVGSYVLVAEESIPVVGGPGDVGTFSGNVPNIAGHETYAVCQTP